MTASSEPTIAIMSATAHRSCTSRSPAAPTNDGARNFTRHGFGPPSETSSSRLAARRLDPDVDLALGHAVALGDDLEVVDQRLHRGVELLARRQHDLAVVRDPRLALHLPSRSMHWATIRVDSRISSMRTL